VPTIVENAMTSFLAKKETFILETVHDRRMVLSKQGKNRDRPFGIRKYSSPAAPPSGDGA